MGRPHRALGEEAHGSRLPLPPPTHPADQARDVCTGRGRPHRPREESTTPTRRPARPSLREWPFRASGVRLVQQRGWKGRAWEASTAFDSVSASVFCKIKTHDETAPLQTQMRLNEGHFPKGRRAGLCQLPPRVGGPLGAKGAQEGWTLEGTSKDNAPTSWKPEPPRPGWPKQEPKRPGHPQAQN